MGCGASAPKKDTDIAPYMEKPAPAGEPPLDAIKSSSSRAATIEADVVVKKELPKPKGKKLAPGTNGPTRGIAKRIEANEVRLSPLSSDCLVCLSVFPSLPPYLPLPLPSLSLPLLLISLLTLRGPFQLFYMHKIKCQHVE